MGIFIFLISNLFSSCAHISPEIFVSVFIIIINPSLAIGYKLLLVIFQFCKNLSFYVIKCIFYSFCLWYHALKDRSTHIFNYSIPFSSSPLCIYMCMCSYMHIFVLYTYIYIFQVFTIWKIIWKCKLSPSMSCHLLFLKSLLKLNFLINRLISQLPLSFCLYLKS